MSALRYRCKVKVKISFEHELEVDTDNPYGDAFESAKCALQSDPFIIEHKAHIDFVSLDSQILDEKKE